MPSEKKIFAVIAATPPELFEELLKTSFPDVHLSVGEGQWLLIGPASMTTQELSGKLGLTNDPKEPTAIVLSVSSYFGRAPINIWEWLVAKMGDASAAAG